MTAQPYMNLPQFTDVLVICKEKYLTNNLTFRRKLSTYLNVDALLEGNTTLAGQKLGLQDPVSLL